MGAKPGLSIIPIQHPSSTTLTKTLNALLETFKKHSFIMQFSVSVSALALVASAIAQAVDFNAINTPQSGEIVPAGSVFPIKWKVSEKYQSGTVSIDLLAGDSPETLTPAMNLASKFLTLSNLPLSADTNKSSRRRR